MLGTIGRDATLVDSPCERSRDERAQTESRVGGTVLGPGGLAHAAAVVGRGSGRVPERFDQNRPPPDRARRASFCADWPVDTYSRRRNRVSYCWEVKCLKILRTRHPDHTREAHGKSAQ